MARCFRRPYACDKSDLPPAAGPSACFWHPPGSSTNSILAINIRVLLLAVVAIPLTEALQFCNADTGGGICPDNNTCCPVTSPIWGRNTSGCIPNDMGGNGVCCGDGETGCPRNYTCSSNDDDHDKHGPNGSQQCRSIAPWQDPLVAIVPRYRLCTAPQLQQVYGFPVDPTLLHADGAAAHAAADSPPPSSSASQSLGNSKLLYYSSHGDILDLSTRPEPYSERRHSRTRFKAAVVGIHGSGRNADDYFCTLLAAASSADHRSDDHDGTLILAPRFPFASDSDLTNITSGGTALVWPDTDSEGTWRYGADDLNYGNVSSFRAVDDLVRYLSDQRVAEHVTVVGHSSGGQFVQRWALVSSVESTHVSYVVANPSSYAYLSPLRWLDGHFRLPDQAIYRCPDYNAWEWGFDPPYQVSYVQRVMDHFTLEDLRVRFAQRQVVYLIGSQDKCSGYGSKSWCDSHGLETTCRDELQGPDRWERHFRYLDHLSTLGIPYVQHTVPGVGHDHSLMFNSEIGRSTLFPQADNDVLRAVIKHRAVL